MKQINKNTLLKQGDEEFQLVEIDDVFYWVDKVRHMTEYVTNGTEVFKPSDLPSYSTAYAEKYWKRIVAQSQPKLDGVPVISDFIIRNTYIYTQKDIKKAIELARYSYMSEDKILEQINSISVIEVDESFNIIRYV